MSLSKAGERVGGGGRLNVLFSLQAKDTRRSAPVSSHRDIRKDGGFWGGGSTVGGSVGVCSHGTNAVA